MKQEKSQPRIHKSICNECGGNGFIRFHQIIIQLWNWKLGYSRVRDCEMCDSQREITYDAKVYNGMDVLTIMSTEKSLKGHAYDSAKKAWTEVKEGKKFIYDKTWGLTDH